MSDTGLLYSDVEQDLRASVRALVADRAPWPQVLARTERDDGTDTALWHDLAAGLGVAGLAVPEELGGAGASWREAAVVAEELGAGVVPVPFLGSAVLATAALLAARTAGGAGGGEAAGLLSALATGQSTAALAVSLATPPGAALDASPDASPDASVRASGGHLTGTVANVADAITADVLLVPAGGALWAVRAADAQVAQIVSLDMTRRLADITLTDAPAVQVGDTAAVQAALSAGAALLAAEQLGVADRCLSMTIDYVKTRHQFGRPVGSYQGLKHRLADLWVAITQARAVSRYAAGAIADAAPDAPVAAALAQAHCGPVAVRAAEECVQMHGGIGFTWEHPAHLYLKRAKSASIALGTADRHRAAIAALVDLPA